MTRGALLRILLALCARSGGGASLVGAKVSQIFEADGAASDGNVWLWRNFAPACAAQNTNGNPVAPPDTAAGTALDACFGR